MKPIDTDKLRGLMIEPSQDQHECDRFWAKVDVRGADECWPWMGSTNERGYGSCRYNGKTVRTHRLALTLAAGPSTLLALHACDNPPCCNPAHLRWGTHEDNYLDALSRNRRKPAVGDRHRSRTRPDSIQRASAHGRAVLTEEAVREIRAHHPYKRGDVLAFARKFGVSRRTIGQARDGETWTSI